MMALFLRGGSHVLSAVGVTVTSEGVGGGRSCVVMNRIECQPCWHTVPTVECASPCTPGPSAPRCSSSSSLRSYSSTSSSDRPCSLRATTCCGKWCSRMKVKASCSVQLSFSEK